MLFFAYFLVIMNSKELQFELSRVMDRVMDALGVNPGLISKAFGELFRQK